MFDQKFCSHHNGVSEIMAPNNFGSALSKAALKVPLKGPLKGPLKDVIGRLQLIIWTSCGVIKSKPRRRRRRRGAAAAEPLIQRRRYVGRQHEALLL